MTHLLLSEPTLALGPGLGRPTMGPYDAHHNIATELIGSDALCSAFDVTNVGESPRRLPCIRLRVSWLPFSAIGAALHE